LGLANFIYTIKTGGSMIKLQNNTATREPIPEFLFGLAPESLQDLSWTDAQLGVTDCAWWPEYDISALIDPNTQKYGAETLTIDAVGKKVDVNKAVVQLTVGEIREMTPPPAVISMRQARLALRQVNLLAVVDAAVLTMADETKISWEYSTEVDIANPLVLAMKSALGWTSAELEDLFILAEGL
jgi:hypothetical protein